MSLREQITADMKEAMRARDTTRLEAVRLLRAAIQRREVDEQIELTDDEVLSVIQKMIKQGRDSIEQFEKGDRQDLVEKETAMLAVLEPYLPDALSDEDLATLIAEALDPHQRRIHARHGPSHGLAETQTARKSRHGCRKRRRSRTTQPLSHHPSPIRP